MDQHYLTPLFSPRSLAVIGASERPESLGRVVLENLVHGGYKGEVHAVNPKRKSVLGRRAVASVEQISGAVDLAVICTPARLVPEVMAACGRKGVKAALVFAEGFGNNGPEGRRLLAETLSAARAHRIRLLGPNCLGFMRPVAGLNLTFSTTNVKPGAIALVSQSGALTNAILDWAETAEVGFSNVITLGDAADVAFGDILDYLVSDVRTDSILLYLEGVYAPRRFVSALRAAARVKPVIVVKTGREPAAYKAAITHSGALVGSDEVFDTVLRRAGAVRVRTFTQLFSAAMCLSSRYRPTGKRLGIITNGGGPGIISADWAASLGLEVPELAAETVARLNATLPPLWSRGNPVDLCGSAGPEHYRAAIEACQDDPNLDGVLVILTPQVQTRPVESAKVVVELADRTRKPLIACWMGESRVAQARRVLAEAHVPSFRVPEPAVESFSHIATYYQAQRLLVQVPYSTSHLQRPDIEGARLVIEAALSERRKLLTETESKAVLAAFHIPVARTAIARSLSESIAAAEQTGFPVAMKVNSPDLTHKSDVGGVKLGLANATQVRAAFHEIMESVAERAPGARIDGVAIQPMTVKRNGRELLLGIFTDPVFGPVLTFGAGGTLVEVLGDRAMHLPPLNIVLARDMMSRTRIARVLEAFRGMPPADVEAVERVLLRVSEIACELPWVRELDINPLIVDEDGAIAADARIVVDMVPVDRTQRYGHMAIYPYPSHLVQNWQLSDGTDVMVRPIRPEDAELLQTFVRGLSDESKYFRFISTMHELSERQLVRMSQIDYDREMALLAVVQEGGRETEIGAARYVMNPDGHSCEFALVVGDAWHGRGIGTRLMLALMDVARARGLNAIEGDVLSNNHNMLRLMTSLGFSIATHPEDPSLKRVVKAL